MTLTLQAALLALQLDSIAGYVEEHQERAIDALIEAARAHQVLIVGDVHPAAAPKRLLSELLPELYARGLVDALALEVPMTQQPAIREYLGSDPEDLQILFDHPLVLRAHWGASREYLDIYRTVWRLNRESPIGRRIRILAIDAPRGPPMVASRREALARFVNRDVVMQVRIKQWREQNPDKRLVVLVGDLHTLKGIEANVEADGEFARLVPLATRLERDWPGSVASAFSDLALAGHEPGASHLFAPLWAALGEVGAAIAVSPGPPLDRISAPVNFDDGMGDVKIEILPPDYTLSRVADLYLYFGRSPALTPLDRPKER